MKTSQDAFGGPWTQDKLNRLRQYLAAYTLVFKNQSYYETVYVDAFAGTGTIHAPALMQEDEEAAEFLNGSARVALDIEPPFNHYIFIERDVKKFNELQRLRLEYWHMSNRLQFENADASDFLVQWCKKTDWNKTRAVVFLDPFGMQVEWSLLEAIAATKHIDLWLLVPIGMGANRLMTKNEMPPDIWADKLTRFFGTDEWRGFYQTKQQPSLFGDGSEVEKAVKHDEIAAYFVNRLKTIFPAVAGNPLTQLNSKKAPLFLLCFAAGQPEPALRIAQHILK